MAKVSIVLPLYNKEEYVDTTLRAVRDQTFQNWELVIVDDGSTDNSSKIAGKHALEDNRIKMISQENKGVSAARNRGIRNASGEWIWFVDADDIPDKYFLSNVFSDDFTEHIDIIVGNYKRIEKNKSIQSVKIEEKGSIPVEQFPAVFMKYQYATGYWGYLWNKLIRRQKLEKYKIRFQEGLSLAEDLKLMSALYRKNAKVFCVPYFAMQYTVDADHSAGRKKADYLSQLEIQLEIKEWIVDDRNIMEKRDFFKQRISSYAAFAVFYGYEDNRNWKKTAETLLANQRVVSQLSTKNIERTMRPIVWCLKNRKIFMMNLYLYLRKRIRDIYRRWKRDE